MTVNEISKKIDGINKKISSYKVELEVNKRQIEELIPQKNDIEEKCKNDFKCSIEDLPEQIKLNTEKLMSMLIQLENQVAEIDNGY